MVSHLEPSSNSYPSWELTSHTYKRAVMNRIDGLRNGTVKSNQTLQNKLDHIRQSFAEELKELSRLIREENQTQAHLTGAIRTEIKFLPVIPVPKTWGLPAYQFGQRVLMTDYNLIGIVTGIEYSDGTVHDAGWHYMVKLDYNPVPRDEIELAIESDLKPLGLTNDQETCLTIVK